MPTRTAYDARAGGAFDRRKPMLAAPVKPRFQQRARHSGEGLGMPRAVKRPLRARR